MAKKLIAYRVRAAGQRIVPGQRQRSWMDETDKRYAYRCLPLTIANAMGWEILLPGRVIAEWNGGKELCDVSVETDDPVWSAEQLATSHFGHGILTFPVNYLFRTDPGVAVWARGVPNRPKDGIVPCDGVIETDWLSFTFTMNWQFTRPGRVVFDKDEPFCYITLVEYRALEDVTPAIIPIEEEPKVAAEYKAFEEARKNFNAALKRNDPHAVKQGWQKWYLRGECPFGGTPSAVHASNITLAAPIERHGACPRPTPEMDSKKS
jgi:hypothetical protein